MSNQKRPFKYPLARENNPLREKIRGPRVYLAPDGNTIVCGDQLYRAASQSLHSPATFSGNQSHFTFTTVS